MRSDFNWSTIFKGTTKTDFRNFLEGNLGLRSLIKNAKTNVCRKELYRLERSHNIADIRRMAKNALAGK